MLTIQFFRDINPELREAEDSELEEARVAIYEIVQLAFEVWHYRKTGSKNPVGLLTPEGGGDTI